MTEQPDEMTVCPHCGGKNLPHATRCVHCGEEMGAFFAFDAQGTPEDENAESQGGSDSISEVLRSLREGDVFEPILGAASESPQEEPTEDESVEPEVTNSEQPSGPEWLRRIRQKAQQEESGSAENRDELSAVDREFNDWIARIREKTQREALNQARAADTAMPADASGTPEWLRKVRALNPQGQDDSTDGAAIGNEADEWEMEWTDERLRALREKALSEEPEIEQTRPGPGPGGEPGLAEEGIVAAAAGAVELPTETRPAEFHNIPDEEEPAESLPAAKALPEVTEPALEPEAEEEETPPSTEPAGEEAPTKIEEETPALEPILEQAGLASGVENLNPVEVTPDEPKPTGDAPSDLMLLRTQKDFAALLKSMVDQEGTHSSPAKATKAEPAGISRFVLAMLLLAALIATLIISPGNVVPSRMPTEAASAFADALGALGAQDQVLLVTDYQAATSTEMELLLPTVLKQLDAQQVTWDVLTTQPSGLWLTEALLEKVDPNNQTFVNYLPGGSFGLVALANGLGSQTLLGEYASALPQGIQDLRDYDLILLACDSELQARTWMEQVAPWLPPGRIAVVSTMQTAPMLAPYYDSGQIAGYLAGLEDQAGEGAESAYFPARVFQVGLLVLLVLLLLGMIVKADQDTFQQIEKRGEE